MDNPAKISP